MKKILNFESNSIPKSVNNTKRVKRMSLSPGLIYPIDFKLYAPNTTVKESVVSKMFSEPTISPVMGRFRWRTFTFACDLGNYNYDLDRNGIIVNDQPLVSKDGTLNPGILSKFPVFKLNSYNTHSDKKRHANNNQSRLVHPTSLFNYFHYPAYWYSTYYNSDSSVSVSAKEFSALPFICYWDVFRNYFVNRQNNFYPVQSSGTFSDPLNMNSKYTPRYIYKKVSDLDNFFKELYKSDMGVNICTLSSCPFTITSDTATLENYNTPHSGLLHTTYMPDINTAFISSNRKNSISSNATFNVTDDKVSYEQILNASMLKRVLDKIDLTGGTAFDWIEATYGKRERSRIPLLINISSEDINFGDIMTTADTYNASDSSGSPAGKRVASGFMRGGNSGYTFNTGSRFYAIITLGTLVPYVDYDQGFDEINDVTTLSDFPNPDLGNYSLQPRFKRYLRDIVRLTRIDNPTPSDLANLEIDVTYPIGSNEVAGYQPPYTCFRTSVNRVCGELSNLQRHWVLTRYFKWRNLSNPEVQQTFDSTPYVYPEDWNYIFNDVEGRFDNFTLQHVINSKTVLPLSYVKLSKTI